MDIYILLLRRETCRSRAAQKSHITLCSPGKIYDSSATLIGSIDFMVEAIFLPMEN
jgi:hypothetical protein